MSKLEKKYYPLVFVVPALIIFTLFYVCSIAGGFVFSFTNWSIYNFESPEFIGIENFKDLFASQSFLPALGHTFSFAVITTVIKVGLGLVFALLLNRAFKGRDFFRAIIFLPCTIGALVIGYVFTFILQPDTGVLNEFLRGIGLGGLALNWLGDPVYRVRRGILDVDWIQYGHYSGGPSVDLDGCLRGGQAGWGQRMADNAPYHASSGHSVH